MSNSLKNVSLYTVPLIVGNIIPIITLPLFTKQISVTEFGVFALAQTIATYLSGVAIFGMNIGFERNFFEKDDQKYRAELFYTVILLTFGSFTLLGILYAATQRYILPIFNLEIHYADVFIYSYIGLGVVNLKLFFLTFLKNVKNVKSYVWFSIDEIILNFIFQIILVLLFKMGILGLAIGQFLASVIVFILLVRKFLKEIPFELNFKLIPGLFKISFPMTPRIFFGVFGNHFDKYMLGLIGSLNGIGIYNLGQRIAYLTFVFMNAMQNVFSPVVYKTMFEEGEENGGRTIGIYLTKYFYVSAGFGLLVILFSQEVITLLTPPSFHDAIHIVSLLTIYYVTCFFGKQPQLVFKKKTGVSTILSFLSIGITVIVNIIVIPRWGYYGAAMGTLISGIISNLITFGISQRYYNIQWEYKKIITTIFMLISAAFCQYLIIKLNFIFLMNIFIKILILAIFILVGYYTKVVDVKLIFANGGRRIKSFFKG